MNECMETAVMHPLRDNPENTLELADAKKRHQPLALDDPLCASHLFKKGLQISANILAMGGRERGRRQHMLLQLIFPAK